MKVSIVIPVYNEEDHLAACLEAIAVQTVRPYEVLVVDNNSTDKSIAIARQFPFVKILNEIRQGVVHARSRGFDAASSDIIGRIDADTIITPGWVEQLQLLFRDQTLAAVTGGVYYYDVIKPALSGKFDLFFRQRLANKLKNEVFLCGSNMAVRRSEWLKHRSAMCQIGGIHEDFDLALHLQLAGQKVTFDKHLRAGISLRRFDSSYRNVWQYMKISLTTYARHGRRSQWHMYPIFVVVLSSLWFIRLCHRTYDAENDRFTLRQIWVAPKNRVNPAIFVD